MDELERQLFEEVKSDLIMCKHERQRLSEKLDCLIILLRKAWQGDEACIMKLSEIVGIAPPKVIPCKEDINSNHELSREYLQITSSMLDDQLREDSTIRKTTKTLRPSSAKCVRRPTEKMRPVSQRPKSSKILRQRKLSAATKEFNLEVTPFQRNSPSQSSTTISELKRNRCLDNFAMGELVNILPTFSRPTDQEKTEDDKNTNREPTMPFDGTRRSHLFDPESVVGPRKVRPLKAALQQRQDYLRSQTKKRNPRPHTAGLAFHDTEVVCDSPRFCLSHQSPVSSPDIEDDFLFTSRSVDQEECPISVDVFQKRPPRHKIFTSDRNIFPKEKREHFGNVTDALQSVQEMQRMFRISTRKLQKKIGVAEAGYI